MPSSIFVRIYGGILLVIAAVAMLAWGFIQAINEQRADSYRESMATGIFHLIALGISRQQGEARTAWLAEASKVMDSAISIIPPQAEQFSEDELAHLAEGRAVFRSNEEQNYADIYSRIPGRDELYIKTRMSKVSEQQAKALAVFFLEELGHYPGREDQRIQELQRYFPYPVLLMPLQKAGLDRDQQARIRRNEVVLVLKEGSGTRNSSLRIVAPLTGTDRVLVMGPLYIFDWMPMQLVLMVAVAVLSIITIAAYFIIHPLERKLKKMELAVRNIRAGDLSARAQVQGSDEVSQLAHAFNGMAENIQRLIDSQREMTRAVSHELRTPVARLRFGMEMLADTEDLEERHERLRLLDQDVDQLNLLIDEILTYAKLEQGTLSLKFEPVPLHPLLERVGQETRALNTPHRIDVLVEQPDAEAEAEVRYLHRILQNLAGNAVRYARSTVRLSAGVKGNSAWLRVEDDGPGIPEKDRERIFEPFARLDDSRTRASGGYGLGLSIVQRIAFWHGGSVEVSRSPDLGGASFTFRWPVRQNLRHARRQKSAVADNTT
ncbi:MAG TPA: ATP-binding protein [Moraxellaceae bacterium]|nr:ATP-binding protein [Moraxellaceae bacterium]